MAEKSRGTALTIFAILFALLAISNFTKPFSQNGHFVFLGARMSGTGNTVMSLLFGVVLAVYAYCIWTMRRYALPVAYIYAVWVIANMVLFTIKNHDAQQSAIMAIASVAIGIGVPVATAIILTQRSAELS
jgi:hypothetical protein